MKLTIVKYLRKLLYLFAFLFLCLLLMEVCFRFQIIDFYKSELHGLNDTTILNSEDNNVLVFGDSFTAHPDSYVKHLNVQFPELNFINCAIPGSGIKQHELIIENRIETYQPKAIIYQFYVGNDFTDLHHPFNYNDISMIRNLYWWTSERLLFLQYINYKLAFLKSNQQTIESLHDNAFSVTNYNQRVKTYYTGNSNHLNNTIHADETNENVKEWLSYWNDNLNTEIPTYLVMIPHNAQVNQANYNNNIALGASLNKSTLGDPYPLLSTFTKLLPKVKILSPLTYFKNLTDNSHLYYANDPHLTESGQKELANYLIQKLEFPK